jgi:hypothetical protein
MTEPTVTRLPAGVSGQPEEGATAHMRRAGKRGNAIQTKRAAASKPKPKRDLVKAREYAREWYRKNRAKGKKGAARATKRGSPAAPRAMTAAPESFTLPVGAGHANSTTNAADPFAPSPHRLNAYAVARDELIRERDGLNVIIAHLERLLQP